jgi:transposase
VLWIARTGAPWPDLPERFGKYDTVYQRFNNWAKRDAGKRFSRPCGSRTSTGGCPIPRS